MKPPEALRQIARDFAEATTSATGAPLIYPTAHAGQQAFLNSDHPRRLLVAHRRFGKDWACVMDIRNRVARWKTEPHRRQLSPAISIGVIYPTYPLAREFWAALKRMMPRAEVTSTVESMPPRMCLEGGAEIEVRTGSDPEMLVAAGYDLVILGEAARLSHEAWLQLMPALASPGRAGLAVHQSTPKGQNWIAEETRSDAWWKLIVPWGHELANPHIDPRDVEAARQAMPERWFRQEWMADFLTSEGAVFRLVRERVAAAPAVPTPPLVAGIDLAKHSDFSVFVVFDSQGHMVAIDRMNEVSYEVQAERLVTFLATHGVRKAVIESNGPGEPMFDMVLRDLRERRQEFPTPCELVPFATTAQSKRQMIDALVVAFERGQITILPDEDLLNEFEAFEMTLGKTGNYRFAAPSGGWDDRVMACALAWTETAPRRARSFTGPKPGVFSGLQKQSYVSARDGTASPRRRPFSSDTASDPVADERRKRYLDSLR